MDTSPLVTEEIDAGTEFLQLLNDLQPVRAACWLRAEEHEERYLYVALDGLSTDNMDVAYADVLQATGAMKQHYMDPFRVKLIRTSDPIAKAVMDIYKSFPGRIPTRFGGRVFAGMAFSEVYMYPPLRSTT